MKPGDILYTGKVISQAESDAYNRLQRECDSYLRSHPESALKSGSLANRAYNFLLNQKHRLFESIAHS